MSGPDQLAIALVAWLRDGTLPPSDTAVEIDGQLIDLVAVRLVLIGHQIDLSVAERRFAVGIAAAAGWSANQTAGRLRIKQRSVVRHRTALRNRSEANLLRKASA